MSSQAHDTSFDDPVNPRAFIAFCDGLEEAGLAVYALRGRIVARELERSQKRVADLEAVCARITAERDRWRDDRWREAHGQAWPA